MEMVTMETGTTGDGGDVGGGGERRLRVPGVAPSPAPLQPGCTL